MSQFACSFAVHCTSECDVSTRYPNRTQFFPLNSCVSDVKARPLHGRRKGKVSRGVNLKMSKEVKETLDVLLPVGSGKRDH